MTIKVKGFPPIKIPQDGTKIGIDGLKNIIDISLKTRKEIIRLKSLKNANWFKKVFGGYFKFALFGLDVAIDLGESAPQIAKEVKDLDYAEIEHLVESIAQTHELNVEVAQQVFETFKKVLTLLEDGVITLAELNTF